MLSTTASLLVASILASAEAHTLPQLIRTPPLFRRQGSGSNATVNAVGQTSGDTCNQDNPAGLTLDRWNEFGIGNYVEMRSTVEVPFTRSLMNALKADAGLETFTCGFDQQCETAGVEADFCPVSDPKLNGTGTLPASEAATAGPIAIAHFTNFFRAIVDKAGNSLSVLSDELPSLTNTFAPAEQSSIEPGDPIADPAFGLLVGGVLAGLIPPLAPLSATAVLLSAIIRKIVPVPDALPPPSNFQAFADVSKTLSDLPDGLNSGLDKFVTDRLTFTPLASDPIFAYRDDPDELPQILKDGKFAEAVVDIPDSFEDSLRQVTSANLINKLWNDEKVFVVKFSVAAFQGQGGEGTNPCQGDNMFNADVKFCDGDGNAYVLQRVPLDPVMDALSTQDVAFNDLTVFAVPGFSELGGLGLSVETITQLSKANQDHFGYFGQPSTADFASRFDSLQPADVDLTDAMLFNLPACDIDGPGLISQQQQGITCPERFDGQDVDKCIFLLKVLCGCGSQAPVMGKGWPYSTGGDKGPCAII